MPGFWANMGGLALERINGIWDAGGFSYDEASDSYSSSAFSPSGSDGAADSDTMTSGNVTLNSTSFADITGLSDLTVDAEAGDVVSLSMSRLVGNEATHACFDAATIVSAAVTNYVTSGTGTPANEGVQAWRGWTGEWSPAGGTVTYTVQAGDVDSGQVTFRFRYRTTSATDKTLYSASATPVQVSVVNHG